MPTIASLAIDFTTNVAQIANDMSRVNRTVTGTMRSIRNVAATTFATFIPAATVTQALEMAGNLHDLSEQTSIAAEALQTLKIVAGENTVSSQNFDAAVQKMTVSIGRAREGAKSYVEAFSRVGVTQRDLQSLSPEQLLSKMEDGFAGLKTQADRAAAASEIFGKAAGPGMAVFMAQGSAAIVKQTDDLKKMGIIMNNDLVTAAGRANDMLGTIATTTRGAFNAGFLQQTQGQFHQIEGSIKGAAIASHDLGSVFGYVAGEAAGMLDGLTGVNGQVSAWATGMETIKLAAVSTVNVIKFEILAVEELIASLAGGLAETARLINVIGTGLGNKMGGNFEESEFLSRLSSGLQRERASIADDMVKVLGNQGDAITNWAQFIEGGATIEASRQFDILSNSIAKTAAAASLLAPMSADEIGQMNSLIPTQNSIADSAKKITDQNLPDYFHRSSAAAGKLGRAVVNVKSEADKMGQAFGSALEQITRDAFSGALSIKSLGDVAAQLAGKFFQTPGFQQGVTDFFGDIFGGFRAGGGSVAAGKSYIVGERGPELLQMGSQGGRIIPNNALSGGGVNVTIVNNTGAPVTQSHRRDSSGGVDMRVVIGEMVASTIGDGRGPASRTLANRGLPPVLTQR